MVTFYSLIFGKSHSFDKIEYWNEKYNIFFPAARTLLSTYKNYNNTYILYYILFKSQKNIEGTAAVLCRQRNDVGMISKRIDDNGDMCYECPITNQFLDFIHYII